MLSQLKRISILLAKQYTSIGGQAVIEGVMMRSPHTFVIAVRKSNGKILLRQNQWIGIGQRISLFKKPFFRGVVTLIESMMNGITALNYSAQVAMGEELKQNKEGTTEQSSELILFFTTIIALIFGMGLFVFVPHATTEGVNRLFSFGMILDGHVFHFVDGIIKACLFIVYIRLIGLIPEIKRVFEYHGAEHKSIATFEAQDALIVDNAKKYSILHPRCGTSFVFFLLFISIIFFSTIFSFIHFEASTPTLLKHLFVVLMKLVFMLPIIGISYELIKISAKYNDFFLCKFMSFPGMLLQKLTTRNPGPDQLEVALASIRAALILEEAYDLKHAAKRVISVEEVEIDSLEDLKDIRSSLTEFLE